MNVADVVAIATTAATVLTVGISIFSLQTARAAEKTARDVDVHERMPVLVCPSSNGNITVRNVGKGPALNIIIARAGRELASRDARTVKFDELTKTSWDNAAHLEPIEAGEKMVFEWSAKVLGQQGPSVAGLSYTDALGLPYTTLAGEFGTKIFVEGNAMPDELKLSDLNYPRRLS